MRSIRLTIAARKDIADIRRYTVRRWGPDQADRYIRELNDAFGRLVDGSITGLAADEIDPSIRRLRQGSHNIFYEDDAVILRIVRVLHERMDFAAHLKHD